MAPSRKFGDALIAQRLITQDQLQELLNDQRRTGQRLGKLAAERKLITDVDLLTILAQHLNVPSIDLGTFEPDAQLFGLLPEAFMLKSQVMPLFLIGSELSVAMTNPQNVEVIDEIKRLTGYDVSPMLCAENELQLAFNKHFKGASVALESQIQDALNDYQLDIETVTEAGEDRTDEELEEAARDTPIIRLSNLIISAAIQEGASDIHVEPDEKKLLVRFRIDGLMKESFVLDKKLQSALISRFKIMSGLDIAEKRLPQDGRFQTRIGHRPIDFRISSFPTIHGENLVMRILDKSSVALSLDKLGFDKNTLLFFNELIRRPHGIILVTGPTGSGKTTTLYSGLHAINSVDKNIITVEDPIEYRLDLVRQCQIHAKIGLTFAAGLRSILRQDPDVIMVGEIRDKETAHISIESALTGHLVFSTLHTNDAPGAINRLIDMGIEPFLVASSMAGVLAQRLVRKLCPKCREAYTPDAAQCKTLGLSGQQTFYRAKGCPDCGNRGYKGRMAVYELMMINDEIRKLTIERASAARVKEAALENGMRTLRRDGIQKAHQGLTTLEEVWRVTSED